MWIFNGSSHPQQLLMIEPTSGNITLKKTLDRETVETITLKIHVEDLKAAHLRPQTATGMWIYSIAHRIVRPMSYSLTTEVLSSLDQVVRHCRSIPGVALV